MKKLNRKGFTLVELLAVIIILAIVVGITIPAVLTMVDNARKKAAEDGAAIVADWVDKQYGLYAIGFTNDSIDAIFKTVCIDGETQCTADGGVTISESDSPNTNFNTFVTTAGLKTSDVSSLKIIINSTTGRSCVTLTPKSSGNFYVNRQPTLTHDGGTC